MSEHDSLRRFPLRAFLKGYAAWAWSALVLLLLFSFILSRTAASEQVLAYSCSALAFLAACTAGAFAAREAGKASIFLGLCWSILTVALLLLLGFLIDRSRMDRGAVLSMSAFTFAGAMFGCVFLGRKETRKYKHASSHQRR